MKRKACFFKLSIVLTCFLLPFQGRTEGSKELMADTSSRAALCTVDGKFAGFNSSLPGNEYKRLNIHIANPLTEVVYLGFSRGYQTGISSILGEASTSWQPVYYFRIKDPSGNIVFGPQAIDASNAIPAGISGYNQIVAGPSAIAGAAGYAGFTFTPAPGSMSGDYYIEFNNNPTTFSGSQCSFDYWDITVANTTTATPVALPGRIWTKQWGFYSKDYPSGPYSGVFKGTIFSYTSAGFVHKVDFSNSDFRGGSFLMGLNSRGPGNTGNIITDRQSIFDYRIVGTEYKLFLNNPDISIYPTADETIPLMAFNNVPVAAFGTGDIAIDFSISRAGMVDIILDFNGNGIFDAGTRDVMIAKECLSGNNSIYWNRKDGLNNTVTDADLSLVDILIRYQIGTHHISLADIEYLTNGFSIELIRPIISAGFVTKFYWDDTQILNNATNNYPYASGVQPNTVELSGAPVRKWDHFTTNATNGFGNGNSINTWWNSYEHTQTARFIITNPLSSNREKFTATLQGEIVILDWTITDETNHANYVVEHSSDSYHFSPIGEMAASNKTRYSLHHTSPVDGTNYYRLKIEDTDAKFRYTKIAKAFIEQAVDVNIYPNPTAEILHIVPQKWMLKNQATISILGMNGALLHQKNISQFNKTEVIRLSNFANGKYWLKLSTGNKHIIKPFQVTRK